MKGSDDNCLKKAKTAFRAGDKVKAYSNATNTMQSGKVEFMTEHFVVVLFNRGYRQCYDWFDIQFGNIKKF